MKKYALKYNRYLEPEAKPILEILSTFIQTELFTNFPDIDNLQWLYLLRHEAGSISVRFQELENEAHDPALAVLIQKLQLTLYAYHRSEALEAAFEDLLDDLITDFHEEHNFVLSNKRQQTLLSSILRNKKGRLRLPIPEARHKAEHIVKQFINPLYEVLLSIHYFYRYKISLRYHSGFDPSIYTVIEQNKAQQFYLRSLPKYERNPQRKDTVILEGNSYVVGMIHNVLDIFQKCHVSSTSIEDIIKEAPLFFPDLYKQLNSLALKPAYRKIISNNLWRSLVKCSLLIYQNYLCGPVRFKK